MGVASVAQAQDVVIDGDASVVEQAPADDALIVPETAPVPASTAVPMKVERENDIINSWRLSLRAGR